MKKILFTDNKNSYALIARWAIAIVIFPHGAQKVLGWFGGAGLSNTIDFFSSALNIPVFLTIMVLFAEFLGAILLAIGLYTRLAALLIAFNFLGVLFTVIGFDQFFMNWSSVEAQKEGLEYFILLFGLISIVLVSGGGKASLDAKLFQKK